MDIARRIIFFVVVAAAVFAAANMMLPDAQPAGMPVDRDVAYQQVVAAVDDMRATVAEEMERSGGFPDMSGEHRYGDVTVTVFGSAVHVCAEGSHAAHDFVVSWDSDSDLFADVPCGNIRV